MQATSTIATTTAPSPWKRAWITGSAAERKYSALSAVMARNDGRMNPQAAASAPDTPWRR
jgi:hypothetical protein